MHSAPPVTITSVITDFLGIAPSLEEIIAFRLPDDLEARGLELLTLSREGRLSNETEAELEEFTRLGHLMNRVKLKARLKLAGHE